MWEEDYGMAAGSGREVVLKLVEALAAVPEILIMTGGRPGSVELNDVFFLKSTFTCTPLCSPSPNYKTRAI